MESPKKQTIIDVEVGNVLATYSGDKVILVGSYFDKNSLYIENVDIVINPGSGGPATTTKIPYSGYYLQLFIGDFNGDNKDEIMLRGDFGGTGGFEIAIIYEYKDDKLIEIFNPDKFSDKYKITAQYLEGYKLLVNSLSLNEYFTYDLSNRPKQYLDMIYDENGKVRDYVTPSVSAINEAFPIKFVFKKNYSLFIRQRIVGVANSDTIGYVESFVSLLDNNITVDQMGYYNFGQKENESRDNYKELINKFPLGTIFIEDKNKGVQVIEIDLDLNGVKEYLVPYTLDGIPYLGLVSLKNGDYKLSHSFKGDGYSIGDLIIKNINNQYYIFIGFEIGGNVRNLQILSYKDDKLTKAFNDNGYFYTKLYIEDIDGDGTDELILWLQDTGESYTIDIYSIELNGLNLTNKYDKIYYKKVIDHYKKQLLKHEGSSTYLYYLSLAYLKVGDYKNAGITIDQALQTKYPYPSLDELKKLKKTIIKRGR